MYMSKAAKLHLENIYDKDLPFILSDVCQRFSGNDQALADRLQTYVNNGWIKFSSAILATAVDSRALPISCFLSHVDDTIEGLIGHTAETSRILIRGGGISGDWSNVRSPNKKSPGPLGFMNTINSVVKSYRQGIARRGNYASYMNVSHPSILEFIHMRIPEGDQDRVNLNLHHAVNITNKFMQAVVDDGPWHLICPKTNEIKETLKARALWETILTIRYRTGEPYLNFIDTVNAANPIVLKLLGYDVTCSNLCNEIHLPTESGLTAVCCLSSMNVAEYDAWKDTEAVGDVIEMLDNVLTYFIQHAPETLSSAIKGAELFRPLGLGVLGLAQLYQRKSLPFESQEAAELNKEIFNNIKQQAVVRTKLLAEIRGSPSLLQHTGRRNSHLLAVAPTTNSATILNTSPSIEPWPANAYTNRTKSGSVLIKNPELEILLDRYGKNTQSVWNSIIVDDGSVQKLSFLSDHEKLVFKTAYEMDQTKLIIQAADRQKYICQGQSLTLFLPKNTSKSTMHKLHYLAWKLGCKGMYYIRTKSVYKVETIVECESCAV